MYGKNWLGIAAAVAFGAAHGGGRREEKVLNVYNWSDYVAEDTISNFEERTGIKVNYDVFDSTRCWRRSSSPATAATTSWSRAASFMERQIQAGVFAKLDKGKLGNYGNLDEAILERLAAHDPGNEHAVPYMWGTTGIGYNVDKVREVMPDAPADSWGMLYDPEVIREALGVRGGPARRPDRGLREPHGLPRARPEQREEGRRQAVRGVHDEGPAARQVLPLSQNINDLANGEICVCMGWSGDMLIARDRAAEAGQGVEIAYTIPKEGAIIWFDSLAIPSDAPHPENAHLFIDYIMEPEVTAAISNYVYYANGNRAALPYVDDEVKTDPSIYPPAEVRAELFPISRGFAQVHPPAHPGVDQGEDRPVKAKAVADGRLIPPSRAPARDGGRHEGASMNPPPRLATPARRRGGGTRVCP